MFEWWGVEMIIHNVCTDLSLDDDDPFFSSNAIQEFNNSLQNMFDFYLLKYGASSNVHDLMASGSSSSRSNSRLNLYNNLRNMGSKRSMGNTPSSEFGRYLDTDFLATMLPEEFDNFDVLVWWKDRESHFPILAAMARDLLN